MTRERVKRNGSWQRTLSPSGIVDIISWPNHWCLAGIDSDHPLFVLDHLAKAGAIMVLTLVGHYK